MIEAASSFRRLFSCYSEQIGPNDYHVLLQPLPLLSTHLLHRFRWLCPVTKSLCQGCTCTVPACRPSTALGRRIATFVSSGTLLRFPLGSSAAPCACPPFRRTRAIRYAAAATAICRCCRRFCGKIFAKLELESLRRSFSVYLAAARTACSTVTHDVEQKKRPSIKIINFVSIREGKSFLDSGHCFYRCLKSSPCISRSRCNSL